MGNSPRGIGASSVSALICVTKVGGGGAKDDGAVVGSGKERPEASADKLAALAGASSASAQRASGGTRMQM